MTGEAAHPIVQSFRPIREFKDPQAGLGEVTAVAVFPDNRRIATNSSDGMVRIWDLENGAILIELEGYGRVVREMALSRDGKLIASIDAGGYVVAYDGDTGRPLAQAFKTNSGSCLQGFSPDGATLATCTSSHSYSIELWSTATWQPQGKIDCGRHVGYIQCIRYSPSGELLAVVAKNSSFQQCRIYICNPATKECIANIEQQGSSLSLVWTPDGTRLLSDNGDTIWEWDSSTWEQITYIWKHATGSSLGRCLAVNSHGTIFAFLTTDNHLRLWSLSDRRTVAIFRLSSVPHCITFSADSKHILTGGKDKKISQWAVPKHAWPKDPPKDQVISQGQGSDTNAQVSDTHTQVSAHARGVGAEDRGYDTEILVMNTTVRNACISGELTTAEELLTQEIDVNGNNYRSYANRSVVVARKLDWDFALDDATKSLSIQPSLMGYISKGIALYGKKRVRDARNAFDLASTFIDGSSRMIHTLFIIKSMALFSANQHAEAMDRVRELASTCLNADTVLACRTLEMYMHIQLGNNALDRASPTEAADHFTAAVNTGTFLSKSAHHSQYEELVVFFGYDLTSLWQTANQRRCGALLRAGKLAEVFEAYRYMADMSNESTKAGFFDWSLGFVQELSTFQRNARNADAIPEVMVCRGDNDGKDSMSDINGDINDIEDVVS